MAARKKRQATRGGSNNALPAWIWIGLGVVLGVGMMLLVLGKDWAPLLRSKNGPQPNAAAVAPRASEAAIADDAKARDKPKKNFDFYQVLPEMEVLIPDAELSAKARAEQQARAAQAAQQNAGSPAPTAPVAATAAARYILQAGSFPDPKTADEAKAKLAMIGFVAQVQPVTINGKTWHRVRLGPYASASDLETAKRSLSDNGVSAIALKESGN